MKQTITLSEKDIAKIVNNWLTETHQLQIDTYRFDSKPMNIGILFPDYQRTGLEKMVINAKAL